MKIAGNVFVVTGAGNGIGREVAKEILRQGGKVAGLDIRRSALEETSALAHGGDRFVAFEVDITDREAVEAFPPLVMEALGRIDGLVHVAGIIQRFVTIDELSIEDIERVMNVNFWGTVYLDKALLPYLKNRPEACLIAVSSMGGLVPVPGQGAYGASKAAVKLLTETLYAELQDTNVAVTTVFPGGVATNITENSGVAMPKLVAGAKQPKTTAPDVAGRMIVDAIEQGTPRVLIGSDVKAIDRISRISPMRAITMIANQMKSLLAK
jgi:NAD(P)-dependent dehydrogenase (short-subunit alcohol dehydrogenase family)